MVTYTLDYDTTNNEIVVKEGVTVISSLPLGDINSISGNRYNDANDLITDQQLWNFLDAVKDGINKQLLVQLDIYPGAGDVQNPKNTLHEHENGLLDRLKGNLLRRTWTKTKDKSKMNYVTLDSYLWESGLGHETFIDILPNGSDVSIATFGSYIDPLPKPGVSWPSDGSIIRLTTSLMEHTGFGKSSIVARTVGGDGKNFAYEMDIKCGNGCTGGGCTLTHNGTGTDNNASLFRGNNEKNILLKGSGNTSLKTKTTVMKGWGDKIQVLIYYMYYYVKKLANKDVRMITADMVVYSLCMTLQIPCIYTGMYDRPVTVETHDLTSGSTSFYSILEFNPGTTEENIRRTYLHKMEKVFAENAETILTMQHLYDHPDTPINIQGIEQKFPRAFYQGVIVDMTNINSRLNDMLIAKRSVELIPQEMEEIDDLIARIDLHFLIIPIIKLRGNKLTMLLGNSYLLNTAEGRKKPALLAGSPPFTNGSFYSIAREYKDRRMGGGGRRQKGGVMEQRQLDDFPTSDRTPKIFRYLREHEKEDVTVPEYSSPNVDRADVFGINDTEKIINLQGRLDKSFDESFSAVHNDGSEYLHETLYTLYIYECQIRRGAEYTIYPNDIKRLGFMYQIFDIPTIKNAKRMVEYTKERTSRNAKEIMLRAVKQRHNQIRNANMQTVQNMQRRRREAKAVTHRNPQGGNRTAKNSGALKRRGGRTHKKSNKRNRTHKRKH